MRSKVIQIKLSYGLLQKLDEVIAQKYVTRSGYIRRAIVAQLDKDAAKHHTPTTTFDEPVDTRLPWQKPPYV